MKKFLLLFTLFLIFYESAYASQFEEVNLKIYETKKLTAPNINSQAFSRINQDGEIISDEEYYNDSEYFRPEEDTSRNKTEQRFQKFVDNVIINNKFNNYTSNFGNK